jgi:hypothetical protein
VINRVLVRVRVVRAQGLRDQQLEYEKIGATMRALLGESEARTRINKHTCTRVCT